jgi:hypothetical protein
MRKRNPIVLPGKELSSYHLSVKSSNLCPIETLKTSILALLELANKRAWIPKGKKETYFNEVIQKNPEGLWAIAKHWHKKINTNVPEESAALAGWMLLKRQASCQKIRKHHKPPYVHLLNPKQETLKKLNLYLYYNSQGTPQEKTTARKDLLAILLLKHMPEETQRELCVKSFGKKTFDTPTIPDWLKLSHGFYHNQTWQELPNETMNTLTQSLLSKETEKTKKWIKHLNLI